MKTRKEPFFIALFLAAFFQCAQQRIDVTGFGGSGTETVGGRAFDSDKKPVSGISVSVRRSDFLDTGSIALLRNPEIAKADTMTDADGNFSLLIGTTGLYTVAMYDSNGRNAALERCTVNQDDSLYVQATLRKTGILSGTINQAAGAERTMFSIYFYGFARHSVMTDDTGHFSVRDLPEGEYCFKVIPRTPIYKPHEGGHVVIVSGEPTDLASIEMQKADFRFHPDDSLVVRAILDSNGLMAIPVDSVAIADASWPHRIIELKIKALKRNNMYFRFLTSKIGDLPELRKIDITDNGELERLPKEIGKLKHLIDLSLRNNNISVIPPEIGDLGSLKKLDLSVNTNGSKSGPLSIALEIGNLTSLESLDVHNNDLSELPSTIGNCCVLKTLDVSVCKLTTLPGELANCKNLEYINAEMNYIDSLPVSITEIGSTFDHTFINFNGNYFCLLIADQIPQKIFEWLDRYCTTSEWRKAQACQGICIPPLEQ